VYNYLSVQVGAQSAETAMLLVGMFPELRFIVQISGFEPTNGDGELSATDGISPKPSFNQREGSTTGLNSHIALQTRVSGTPQIVKDAAAYIVRIPFPSFAASLPLFSARIAAELQAHFDVLAAAKNSMVILLGPFLPEPGAVDPDVEMAARARDLSMLQLANERDLNVSEVVDLVGSVGDNQGRLVVVNKLRSTNRITVALCIKYKTYADLDTWII
jgi:hypothetical protein